MNGLLYLAENHPGTGGFALHLGDERMAMISELKVQKPYI